MKNFIRKNMKRCLPICILFLLLICNIGTSVLAAAPYGEGNYAKEPPPGYGVDISNLFHIVEPKSSDPGINSRVDSIYPNVAIITFDRTNQFGGMWAKEQLDFTMPFSTEMYLYLEHEYDKSGTIADGMTFTMHNDPGELNAIGGAGEGLGVYRGRKWTGVSNYTTDHGTYLRNSLVIEFDTYRNSISEGAHVDDPGNPDYSAHCALIIPRSNTIYIEDHQNVHFFNPTQQWVKFTVTWIPNNSGGGTLNYSFDGNDMSYQMNDINAIFGGTKAYWGFTGSTGGLTSLQAAAITRLPEPIVVVTEKTVENAQGQDINHGFAYPGEPLRYTIRVAAPPLFDTIGPIIIRDKLSAYVEYAGGKVVVTTKDGSQFEVTPAFDDGNMIIDTNQFFSSEGDWLEVTFNVTVKMDAAGNIVYNSAMITAEGLAESQETNTTEVTILPFPEKKVSDSSEAGQNGSAVKAGDKITYEITYLNFEDSAATILIQDKLPMGVDFVSATHGGVYNHATHTVTWTLSDIPSGKSGYVSVVVRVNHQAVEKIENDAIVQVGDHEPKATNQVANPVEIVPAETGDQFNFGLLGVLIVSGFGLLAFRLVGSKKSRIAS